MKGAPLSFCRGAFLVTLGLLAIGGGGCAAPGEEDSEAQGGEIHANDAADRLGGTSVRVVEGWVASSSARAIGIRSWTAYALDRKDFRGAVLFGIDGDGDVKLALFSALKPDTASADIALLNYDKKGPVGATGRDAEALKALRLDVASLQGIVEARLRNAKSQCAMSAGMAAIFAIGSAAAVMAFAAASVPVWVGAGLVGVGATAMPTGFVSVIENVGIGEVSARLVDGYAKDCRLVAL